MPQTTSKPEATRAETRSAPDSAAMSRRRTARAVAPFVPIPEQIDRATRILDAAGVFMTRVEIEQMAQDVAADYCAVPTERCPQCRGTFARGTGWGIFCSRRCADEEMAGAIAQQEGRP